MAGLFVAIGLALALVAYRRTRGERGARAFALALGATPLLGLLLQAKSDAGDPDAALVPRRAREGGAIGSEACKSCHPSEYASWAASYHRTMTQRAEGAAILAPRGDATIPVPGGVARVRHTEGALEIAMPDPEALAAGAPETAADEAPFRRALLTTGSHHYQAYWVAGRRPGELRAAPIVWHREAQRFIPRHDVFLQPPDAPDHLVRWNSNCLACHATGAEPRHDLARDAFNTQVIELGIACEACHGPGGAHADHFRDPVTRLEARGDERAQTFLVNPTKLSKERSIEVCGQCHAYALPHDEGRWWTNGYARDYRAGDVLAESRTVLTPELVAERGDAAIEAASESLFWPDGTIRVSGRELNALAASRCFLDGAGERRIACVDCHRMHGADPDDQLRPEAQSAEVCASCHAGYATPEHTQHREGALSPSCYDCHMPRVSYALYGAQRSHRIDSPTPAFSGVGAKPPACNLCHVDRTLRWTRDELARGWGLVDGGPDDDGGGDDDDGSLSLSLRLALRGDAATRVILADHLLAPSAAAASGDDFQLPILATLLEDRYAAVRFVAARALVAHGDLAPGAYDFLAAPEARAAVAGGLIAGFRGAQHGARPELLLLDGALDVARLRAEWAARDDRDVTLSE